MFAKERKEMRADFRRENDEQNRVIAEQKKQNDEQNRVIAEQKEEMKRLHKRLHRADPQNKEAHRQRDEKQSQERHSSELEDVVESVVKRSIRRSGKDNTNSSVEIELKRLIDHQIDQYLINQKICVAGNFFNGNSNIQITQTVNFGYEFLRTPTVSASLARVYKDGGAKFVMSVEVASVTRSSAIFKSWAHYGGAADLKVSWLACL